MHGCSPKKKKEERNGKSRHPCLVPDLWESIQSFTIKYGISFGFFIDALEEIPLLFLVEKFFFFPIMKGYWILSNAFSVSLEIIMDFVVVVFFFNSIVMITLIDFQILN